MAINRVNMRSSAAALIVFILILAVGNFARAAGAECDPENLDGPVLIERIHLGAGKGEGYRMTYCIDVPLGVYWQFKRTSATHS